MKLMLLLAALVLALSSELVPTDEMGEVRRTSIQLETVRTLAEFESTTDGKPNSVLPVRPDEEKRTLDATFLDTIQRVKGKGRPVSLLRLYSGMVEATSRETEDVSGRLGTTKDVYSSELEGKHVLFKGRWGASRAASPGGRVVTGSS